MKWDNVKWLLAIVAASIVFLYTNFETIRAAQDSQDNLKQRLDRIESKIDTILEK